MRGLIVLILVIAACFFGYKYFSNSETGDSSAKPSAAGTSAAGSSAPLDMTAIETRLKAAAQKVGVAMTKFEPKGSRDAVVTVEWSGDVTTLGADFASEAVLEQKIARDFDEVKVAQPMWTDAQGRRHYRAAFDLKF